MSTNGHPISREAFSQDDYAAAWGLLVALERDDLDLASEITRAFDPLNLQIGLTIVAQDLLRELRSHADDRGCSCGSLEWVQAEALRAKSDG
jgi:hypothetical protein